MAYQISQTDPDVVAAEDLYAEMDGFKVLGVAVVERISLILKSFRKRRLPHKYFQDRILRFWESIADGRLSSEAAILLANQNTIAAILPLPHSRQVEIARGALIPVAVTAPDGTIKSDDIEINRMDGPMLKRAFGPEGIRPVHEQADMIRVEGKKERYGMMTLLIDEHMAKIGNQKIRLEAMADLLRHAGYTVTFTRGTASQADVA